MLYELRSYKAPLLRGHKPIALEPVDETITVDVEVGEYYDSKRGKITEQATQVISGKVTAVEDALTEATRLFSDQNCWHITINEYAKDENGNELRSPIHWCASVEQVQDYLNA